MATSPLLTLARESILEVLQAENIIKRNSLLEQYPLLNQKVATQVALYINNELFSYATTLKSDKTLLEDITFNAKSAAFFGKNILTSAMYLHSEVEVSLLTFEPQKRVFENEPFLSFLNSDSHGIILFNTNETIHIPSHINASNIDEFFADLDVDLNVDSFQVYSLEKARDKAILGEEQHV